MIPEGCLEIVRVSWRFQKMMNIKDTLMNPKDPMRLTLNFFQLYSSVSGLLATPFPSKMDEFLKKHWKGGGLLSDLKNPCRKGVLQCVCTHCKFLFADGNSRHCALLSLARRGQLRLWMFSSVHHPVKNFSNPPALLFTLFPLNLFFQLIQSQSIVICQHNSAPST